MIQIKNNINTTISFPLVKKLLAIQRQPLKFPKPWGQEGAFAVAASAGNQSMVLDACKATVLPKIETIILESQDQISIKFRRMA